MPRNDQKTRSQRTVLQALRKGNTLEQAASHAGISPSTLYNWRQETHREAMIFDSQVRAALQAGASSQDLPDGAAIVAPEAPAEPQVIDTADFSYKTLRRQANRWTAACPELGHPAYSDHQRVASGFERLAAIAEGADEIVDEPRHQSEMWRKFAEQLDEIYQVPHGGLGDIPEGDEYDGERCVAGAYEIADYWAALEDIAAE